MKLESTILTNMLPSDTTVTDLQKISDVLSILSKPDALLLFIMSKDGLKSELETHSKIGLTKKQYYTRLKQLADVGLITKNTATYAHTAFGNMVYQKHFLELVGNIKSLKHFEMIDVLKQSSNFKLEDISEFLSKISPNSNLTSPNLESKNNSIVTKSYDDMVSKVLQIVEFAQKEIILMGRFRNDHIINMLLKKANMGVSVKVLADTNTVKTFFENETDVLRDDKNKKERITTVSNPFYPSKVDRRYIETPFSLLLVDGKIVGMEVVDTYHPKNFLMAAFMEDSSLCSSMRNTFDNLWKKASTNPPQIVSPTKTSSKK
jgi:predicted transcriptional regulator